MSQPVAVCNLGRLNYEEAWQLQHRLQKRLIEAKRSTPRQSLPHVLLLVQHPPVYTLGKSGDADHLLVTEHVLQERDATFVHVDRGGDITFHGPGQLVGYPILDLDRFFTDIHKYLRRLERVIIDTCAEYGLIAGRVEGRTGVWIGPDEQGPERKICAMGVRCSRWVTMHGWAFNVNTDLSYFDHIVPCGIRDRGVTSLQKECGRAIDEDETAERITNHFGKCFDAVTSVYSGREAQRFLDQYGAPIGTA